MGKLKRRYSPETLDYSLAIPPLFESINKKLLGEEEYPLTSANMEDLGRFEYGGVDSRIKIRTGNTTRRTNDQMEKAQGKGTPLPLYSTLAHEYIHSLSQHHTDTRKTQYDGRYKKYSDFADDYFNKDQYLTDFILLENALAPYPWLFPYWDGLVANEDDGYYSFGRWRGERRGDLKNIDEFLAFDPNATLGTLKKELIANTLNPEEGHLESPYVDDKRIEKDVIDVEDILDYSTGKISEKNLHFHPATKDDHNIDVTDILKTLDLFHGYGDAISKLGVDSNLTGEEKRILLQSRLNYINDLLGMPEETAYKISK